MAATSAPIMKQDLSVSSKSATDAGYYDCRMEAKGSVYSTDDCIYQELPVTYNDAYDIIPPRQLSTAKQTSSDCSTVSQREVENEVKKSAGNKMCLCMLATLIIVVLAAIACFTVVFVKVAALKSKYEGSQSEATFSIKALQEEVDRISDQFSAVSCHSLPPSSPSGYYLVRNSSVPVYCHMSLSCGGVTGG